MGYTPHTRLHRLPAADQPGARIWLKREDETGGSIAGGKFRKFSSLLPWLLDQGYQQVISIGSSQSNQVLAAAQLLPQAGIRSLFCLKKNHHQGPGNDFLNRLLIDPAAVLWVEAREWPRVENIAQQWGAEQAEPTYVLPEGAFCPPALPGALSLARDLQLNLQQTPDCHPQHLFVDAGTGLSAIGLLLGWKPNGTVPPPKVHVLLLAMTPSEFEERLQTVHSWKVHHGTPLPYQLHLPQNAASFGAINQSLLKDIRRYAREWGVLTDPIYSGKLFREAERIVREENLRGDIVWVHSGGLSSLTGFYDKLNPDL